MAKCNNNVTVASLPTCESVSDNDYLIVYNSDTTCKVKFSDFIFGAENLDFYPELLDIISTLESLSSVTSPNSGDWNNVFSTVYTNSASWESLASDQRISLLDRVEQHIDSWIGTTTTVADNSATWDAAVSQLSTQSDRWNRVADEFDTKKYNWNVAYNATLDGISAINEALAMIEQQPWYTYMSGEGGGGSSGGGIDINQYQNLYTTVWGKSAQWGQAELDLTDLEDRVDTLYTGVKSIVNSTSSYWNTAWDSISTRQGFWDSTYNRVNQFGDNWDDAFTTIDQYGDRWTDTWGLVSTTSAEWNGTAARVEQYGDNWDIAFGRVNAYADDWDDVYTIVSTFSSQWDESVALDALELRIEDVESTVVDSSKWNNVFNTVRDFSGSWEESVFIDALDDRVEAIENDIGSFLSTSGGEVQGNVNITGLVTVAGDISATGDLFVNKDSIVFSDDTTWSSTDSQASKDVSISYISNSATWDVVANIVNNNETQWNATYNTIIENEIKWNFAYNTILTRQDSWDTAYQSITANEANWLYTYNTLQASKSSWDQAANKISQSSNNWDTMYTTVVTQAPDWNDTYNTVSRNADDWDDTHDIVTANQSDWNHAYNTLITNQSKWDTASYLLSSGKSGWDYTYNKFLMSGDDWDDTHDIVSQHHVDWTNTATLVDNNKTNWDSAYNTIISKQTLWDATQNRVSTTGDDWDLAYDTIIAKQDDWTGTHVTVASNSADWFSPPELTLLLQSGSANWNEAYNAVVSNSADWFSPPELTTIIQTGSADWNHIYNYVNTTSATNNVDYNRTTFVNTSGDTITGDLSVAGHFTGTTAVFTSLTALSSVVDVIDIKVRELSGYDIIDGDLSVGGDVSAKNNLYVTTGDIIFGDDHLAHGHAHTPEEIEHFTKQNLRDFKDTHTNVFNNSADWFSPPELTSLLQTNSGVWNTAYSVVATNSAHWADHTDITNLTAVVATNSAHWSEHTDITELTSVVATNSAHWADHVDESDLRSAFVNVSGDTMTGSLSVIQDITTDGDLSLTHGDIVFGDAGEDHGHEHTPEDIESLSKQNVRDFKSVFSTVFINSGNWFTPPEIITLLNTSSANWNQAYDTIIEKQSDWNDTYTRVNTSGDHWDHAHTIVLTNSSNWNDTYTRVNTSGNDWDFTTTRVEQTGDDWDATTHTVNTNNNIWTQATIWVMTQSATNNADYNQTTFVNVTGDTITGWLNVDGRIQAANDFNLLSGDILFGDGDFDHGTYHHPDELESLSKQNVKDFKSTLVSVRATSAEWDSVYSFVNSDSATNNTDYNRTTFVNTSGDTITGDLAIDGHLTGTTAVFTSLTALSSVVDVIDIKVRELSGYDIIDGDLTVDGDVSAKNNMYVTDGKIVFGDNHIAHGFEHAPEEIEDLTKQDVRDFKSTYSTVSANSATWSELLELVEVDSSNWDSTYETVFATSGNWDSVYNFVNSDSATNNTDYNRTTFVNVTGDTITGDLQVTGHVSGDTAYFNTITALSSVVDVIDIKVRELSGYDIIDGDLTVDGETTVDSHLHVTHGDIVFGDSHLAHGHEHTPDEIERFSKQDLRDFKSTYNSVLTTSANWDTVYADVSITSGNWDSVYSWVQSDSATNNTNYNNTTFVNVSGDLMTGPLSSVDNLHLLEGKLIFGDDGYTHGHVHTPEDLEELTKQNLRDFKSTYTSVRSTSADWDTVYTDVSTTSGDWDSTHASVHNTSADWDTVYADVSITSADWDSTRTSVYNTSGDWNSVYNWVQSDSATNNTSYNRTTFVNVTGDTITGALDIQGHLTGTTAVFTSLTALSSVVDVIDIKVRELSGYDIIDGDLGVDGKVTVDTDLFISHGIITFGDDGMAHGHAHTPEEIETFTKYDVRDFKSTHSSVHDTSANWDTVYTDVSNTSANWDSTHASVHNTSGDWNSVYNWVQSDSATNNTDYNRTTFVNVTGDTITGDLKVDGHFTGTTAVFTSLTALSSVVDVIDIKARELSGYDIIDGNLSVDGDVSAQNNLYITDGEIVFGDNHMVHGFAHSPEEIEHLTKYNIRDFKSVQSSVYNTSGDWNTVYTDVSITSATWDSTYNSVYVTSSDWDSVYTSVLSHSADWESTHTSVHDTSANWDTVYADVSITSGNWNSVYSWVKADSATNNTSYNNTTFVNVTGDLMTGPLSSVDNLHLLEGEIVFGDDGFTHGHDHTPEDVERFSKQDLRDFKSTHASVHNTSANWDTVYTDVSNTSANWDSTHTSVHNTSANWDTVYTDVSNTSANWNSTHISVHSTSANWDSVYNWVQSDSATNNTDYNRTTFVNVTGDTITGDLKVDGHFTGTTAVFTSLTALSSVVDVIDIKVRELSGYDIIDGDLGVGGEVTIDNHLHLTHGEIVFGDDGHAHGHIHTPDEIESLTKYDVRDFKSTHASVYNTSANWDTVYTDVSNTSATWNSTHTSVRNTSANWDTVYANVVSHSADWESTHDSVYATSGNWDSVHASVLATSGDWNSVYNWVQSDSATNNTQYNNTTFVNVSGDLMTGPLSSVDNLHLLEGKLIFGDDGYTHGHDHTPEDIEEFTKQDLRDFKSTESTVNTTSGRWESVYSFVNSDSATNNTDYNRTTFVNVTGDSITGDLSISGHLTGTTAVFTSLTALSSVVDVIDIKVRELSGYDIIDGDFSVDGNTTIKTNLYVTDGEIVFGDDHLAHGHAHTPQEIESLTKYDVRDFKSTHNSVLTTSANWDTVYANVVAHSADWESTHTSVHDTSANWDTVYANVVSHSADWESTHTSVHNTSANWNSVYDSVVATSGNWDSVYSWVRADSATNNSVYNDTTYVNVAGDTMTGSLEVQQEIITTNINSGAPENRLLLLGGSKWDNGARIELYGANYSNSAFDGRVHIHSNDLFVGDVYDVVDGNAPWMFRVNVDQEYVAIGDRLPIDDSMLSIHGKTTIDGDAKITGDITTSNVIFNGTGTTETLTKQDVRDFKSTESTVRSNSADWESVYSFVNSDSATNNTNYNRTTFVNTSGDTITGDLEIVGHLTSDTAHFNTITALSSVVDVIDIKVRELSGYDIMDGDLSVGGDVSAQRNMYVTDGEIIFGDNHLAHGFVHAPEEIESLTKFDVRDFKSTYNTVLTNSADWGSVYDLVNVLSANWQSTYHSVLATSANWDTVYADVSTTSATWDSVYTSVLDTSANWDTVYASVVTTSANWDSVYNWVQSDSATNNTQYNNTTFVNVSGDLMTGPLSSVDNLHLLEGEIVFGDDGFTHGHVHTPEDIERFSKQDLRDFKSTESTVNTTSGRWESVYSFVNADSATNNTDYNRTTFVNVTGDSITGDLNVSGHVSGDTAYFNTITALSSVVDVIDIKVRELSGYDIIDGDLSVGGDVSAQNNMYITDGKIVFGDNHLAHGHEHTPEEIEDLTKQDVRDFKSTHNTVWTNSARWENVFLEVSVASSDWQSTYHSVLATSANWDTVYANVVAHSADWESTHTSVHNTSANWDTVYADVSTTSATWDSVYSWVKADSATNNSVYNDTTYVNVAGDAMTGALEVAGGITTTSIKTNDPTSALKLYGGMDNGTGARLELYGTNNNNSQFDGRVHLQTNDLYIGDVYDTVDGSRPWMLRIDVDQENFIIGGTTAIDNSMLSVHGKTTIDGDTKITGDINTGGEIIFNTTQPTVTLNRWDVLDFKSTESTVKTNSGNWESVYNWVQSDSATNNTDYNRTTFVNTSGDTITGDLEVTNRITSNEAFFTSLTAISSVVDVIDIKVRELSGYDIIDGDLSVGGEVTIDNHLHLTHGEIVFGDDGLAHGHVHTPEELESLTKQDVKDFKSTHASVYATSGNWDSVHASVLAHSADWESTHDSVYATSGNWDSVHASVLAHSADWESTHDSVYATSANWDSTHASVLATSATWDSVYSFVNSDSATNNTNYNRTTFVNTSGDTITGDLEITHRLTSNEAVFTSLTALSTVVDVIDIKVRELSGYDIIDGDLRVDGDVTTDILRLSDLHDPLYFTDTSFVHNFGDDTDSKITDKLKYTHAINVFGTSDYVINNVLFTAEQSGYGHNWSITGGMGNALHKEDAQVEGMLGQMLNDNFRYLVDAQTITMTGLTVGKKYAFYLYSQAWSTDNIAKQATITSSSSNEILTVDQNQFESSTNDGHMIEYVYVANAETVDITITPDNNSSWHLYAFANREIWNYYSQTLISKDVYDFKSTYSTVQTNSGKWESVYSFVNGDSATNNTDYNHMSYVAVSGDTMTGSLSVQEDLTVDGTTMLSGEMFIDGHATFNNGVTAESNVYIKGDLRVDGNVWLIAGVNSVIHVGDSIDDVVVFQAPVDSDIVPFKPSERDLGSIDNTWRNVYADTFTLGDGSTIDTGDIETFEHASALVTTTSGNWNQAYEQAAILTEETQGLSEKVEALYHYSINNFDKAITTLEPSLEEYLEDQFKPGDVVIGDTVIVAAENTVYLLTDDNPYDLNSWTEVNAKPNALFYRTNLVDGQVIDTIDLKKHKTAKYIVEVESRSGELMFTELTLVCNGTKPFLVEYGMNYTTSEPFVEFDATVNTATSSCELRMNELPNLETLWNPGTLSSVPFTWLDAADASKVVFDDQGRFNHWNNSGKTDLYMDAPPGSEPEYITSGNETQNGNNVFKFTNDSDFLQSDYHDGSSIGKWNEDPVIWYLVFKPTGVDNFHDYLIWFEQSTGDDLAIVPSDNDEFFGNVWMKNNKAGSGNYPFTKTFSTTDLVNEWNILQLEFNPEAQVASIYLNGHAIQTNRPMDYQFLETSSHMFRLHANFFGTEFTDGYFGEFLVLENYKRIKTEGYLAWKWGIQHKLPENHIYKNMPPQANNIVKGNRTNLF